MSTPRILVIEDEVEWLQSYRSFLGRDGYEVTAVRTRAEALVALEDPDWWVVLIDRMLQGVDRPDEGTDLLVEVGARVPDAKAFIVTAWIDEAAMKRGFELGAYDYIEKTGSFEIVLRAKVRQAVESVRDRRLARQAKETTIQEAWLAVQDDTATAQVRGRRLEDLILALFRSVPGFSYTRTNRKNDSQEFDVIVRNDSAEPFWARQGDYFVVECKRWKDRVDPKELAHLREKARQRYGRCQLAFIVAWSGFTEGVRERLRAEATQPLLIVPLVREDLERLVQSADRGAELKLLHEHAVIEEA